MKIIILLFLSIVTLFANPTQEHKIKEVIKQKFTEHYPTLHIQKIDIKATSTLIKKLQNFKVADVIVSKDDLHRNKGSVMVSFIKNSKKRKLYFKYHITATIDLYTASQRIEKNRLISSDVSSLDTINFTKLYHEPITDNQLNQYCAKYTIKEGTPITHEKLKKESLIKRNEHISAIIQDGGLVLNFTAIAMQEGNIGDIIKIKKDYKKSFKAQIISNTTVKVLP